MQLDTAWVRPRMIEREARVPPDAECETREDT